MQFDLHSCTELKWPFICSTKRIGCLLVFNLCHSFSTYRPTIQCKQRDKWHFCIYSGPVFTGVVAHVCNKCLLKICTASIDFWLDYFAVPVENCLLGNWLLPLKIPTKKYHATQPSGFLLQLEWGFDSHKKWVYVMISFTVRPASQMSGVSKTNAAIFSDTINVINVKPWMMLLLTELYP